MTAKTTPCFAPSGLRKIVTKTYNTANGLWSTQQRLLTLTAGPLALILPQMKIKIIFLIMIISISCKDKQLKLSTIEYLDFNWSSHNAKYDSRTDNSYVTSFFKCRIYAHIDKSGKTRIFVYGNQYPLKLYYYQGEVDLTLIQELESFSNRIDTKETDSLYARFRYPYISGLHDETNLKMKVTFENNKSKMFQFVNDDYSFNKYPQLLKLKKKINEIRSKKDTLFLNKEEFDKNKFQFLKEAFISDTTIKKPFEITSRILLNDTIVDINDF